MAWFDEPTWPPLKTLYQQLRPLLSLRASPRLLVGVCGLQLLVLLWGVLALLDRTECAVTVPPGGPVVVECETCRTAGLGARHVLLNAVGACLIGSGALAVRWRDGRLLYVYGSAMLFFSLVIGLTAVLTALESPVLDVAVDTVTDPTCLAMATAMADGAREHTSLAALACLVDMAGAVLAIRSKELFSYEEIASQHAEVARSQVL